MHESDGALKDGYAKWAIAEHFHTIPKQVVAHEVDANHEPRSDTLANTRTRIHSQPDPSMAGYQPSTMEEPRLRRSWFALQTLAPSGFDFRKVV